MWYTSNATAIRQHSTQIKDTKINTRTIDRPRNCHKGPTDCQGGDPLLS